MPLLETIVKGKALSAPMPPSCGVEKHVAGRQRDWHEVVVVGRLVAVDHHAGELRAGSAAVEGDLEGVAVQVAAEVLLDVDGADVQRVGVEHAARLERLEAAAAPHRLRRALAIVVAPSAAVWSTAKGNSAIPSCASVRRYKP